MPATTLDPTWINAPGGDGPTYDSEELRRATGFTLAKSGTPGKARSGLLGVGEMELSLSGTTVRLGAGGCAVATDKGTYITGFAAVTAVDTLTPADVTNPRRDRVVVEILDPDNGGGAGRRGQARVITGSPNATAATGGGFPPEPSGPVLTIGYVDVPRSGAGSPSVTMSAPYTAAAGAVIPVRNAAEMNALPKWNGAQCARLDLGGEQYVCNGTSWYVPISVVSNNGSAKPIIYGIQHAVTLSSAGIGVITFNQAFPTKFSSIAFTREHTTGAPTNIMTLNGGGHTTNRFQVTILCTGPTGTPITGTVYIYVTAIGC